MTSSIFENVLLFTENFPSDAPVKITVDYRNGYNWNGKLGEFRTEIIIMGTIITPHRCDAPAGSSFMLRYAYDHKNPGESYHFIIDSNTGKWCRIGFCPWCGEKL